MNGSVQASGTTILPTDVKKWRSDWVVFLVSALLGIVMLWWAGSTATQVLEFQEKLSTLIPGILGSMFLVALFVERMIEVFISVWSDRETLVHEQNLDYWQTRQARLKQDIQGLINERNGTQTTLVPDDARKAQIDTLLNEKRAAIREAEDDAVIEERALLPFEARTRKVSTWIGLGIGIFASAVGFRFLSQIVVLDNAFKGSNQYKWFVVADVLLTGAVLAGGSKLVHQIFSVYESFMESSQKTISDKGRT